MSFREPPVLRLVVRPRHLRSSLIPGLHALGRHQMAVPAQACWQGGLAVISARDIWVVGTNGPAKGVPRYRTLAEHRDGSNRTIVPTPNGFTDGPRNRSLFAVMLAATRKSRCAAS